MLPHHLISLQLISLNIETRLRSCKLFLSLIDSIVAVLSTFCVDDTPVSTQLRLTTKDTSHMRDNAWPEDNKNGIIIQRLNVLNGVKSMIMPKKKVLNQEKQGFLTLGRLQKGKLQMV